MTLSKQKILIKELQKQPRGSPLATADLRALGISASLAYHYVRSGWLTKLCRGVFMFPGDELQRDACLRFLERKIPGLHVGGKTALAWRGIRHNLPRKEHLVLWGEDAATLPDWFVSRFSARYLARHLFDPNLSNKFAIGVLPEARDGPNVSEPERALLEMLCQVGVDQSLEEARHIMEGARSLRPDVLQALIKHCVRVKVVRLCIQWAEELSLPWAGEARKFSRHSRLASRSRWAARLPEGGTLVLKP